MSAPQYCNRANRSHSNQKFVHSLRPQFFFFFFFFQVQEGVMEEEKFRWILIHETSIFTLGAPHEEVQVRQTKLHPVFTTGKLVQPSPGISILRDAHIVLSKRS